MLSDPKRLKTPGGHGYLVSWKHRLRTRSEASAAAVVERLLGDPHNVEALRAGIGRPNATMDELAEWLVTGLASGGLNLLKTRVNPPIFDSPQETDLFDLLPPEEPKRDLDSLTFEVVEQGGEGVAVRFQVYAPSGDPAGSLPAGERRFVGELEPGADVELELEAIVLPLRPEVENEHPEALGPDGVEPEPPDETPTDGPETARGDRSDRDPDRGRNDDIAQGQYEVRVVDELGEPIDGVSLSFFIDGKSEAMTTRTDGVARLDATPGAGTVTVDDPGGMLETLRARWTEVRDGAWLEEAPEHTFVSLLAPLPVVELRSGMPHTLVLQPQVVLGRIQGMLFDTNRSFLLPSALGHLPRLTALYADHPESALLIVGHTDTTGEPELNDPLSLERAQSVAAFLRDDAKAWLARYEPSVPVEKRWGPYEDGVMLTAVFERTGETVEGSPLRHFQRSRGLEPDGSAGPVTREVLIAEYMALDGTTLPDGVDIQVHGCGEQFPLGTDDAHDRRVELLFFPKALGVLPPASGDTTAPGDETYLEWQRRASETLDFHAGSRVHSIVIDDPVFGVAPDIVVEAKYQAGKQLTLQTDIEGRLPLEPGGGDYVDLSYTWQGRDFKRRVFAAVDDVGSPEGAWQRLVHLGYVRDESPEREAPDAAALEDALLLFQMDFGLEPSAALDDETLTTLLRAHDQDLRPWRDRDWDLPDEPGPDAEKPKEEVS